MIQKSLSKNKPSIDKKFKQFPKYMYTLDGQNWYIDGRPVTLQEFIARDGFRKADEESEPSIDVGGDWEDKVANICRDMLYIELGLTSDQILKGMTYFRQKLQMLKKK